MGLDYRKLWKLLIDLNLKKSDLQKITGLSRSTISKLSKGENVNTNVLEKICIALECDICDIANIKERENG